MDDYIATPCPCHEGDVCPHYGRQLVGRIWELSRMDNEQGRKHRASWVAQVQEKSAASHDGRKRRGVDPSKPRIAKGKRLG